MSLHYEISAEIKTGVFTCKQRGLGEVRLFTASKIDTGLYSINKIYLRSSLRGKGLYFNKKQC